MMIGIIVNRWWKCELITMIIIRFLKVWINDNNNNNNNNKVFESWVNNNNNNEIFEKFGLMMIRIIINRCWKCEMIIMIMMINNNENNNDNNNNNSNHNNNNQ